MGRPACADHIRSHVPPNRTRYSFAHFYTRILIHPNCNEKRNMKTWKTLVSRNMTRCIRFPYYVGKTHNIHFSFSLRPVIHSWFNWVRIALQMRENMNTKRGEKNKCVASICALSLTAKALDAFSKSRIWYRAWSGTKIWNIILFWKQLKHPTRSIWIE